MILIKREDGGVSVMEDVAEDKLQHHLDRWNEAQATGEKYVSHEVVSRDAIPADRTFRGAWKHDLTVDVPKAKEIGHTMRRRKREAEFAPHDKVIALQISGKLLNDAEAARAAIRAKYDAVQTAIDAAATPDEIKAALS